MEIIYFALVIFYVGICLKLIDHMVTAADIIPIILWPFLLVIALIREMNTIIRGWFYGR